MLIITKSELGREAYGASNPVFDALRRKKRTSKAASVSKGSSARGEERSERRLTS